MRMPDPQPTPDVLLPVEAPLTMAAPLTVALDMRRVNQFGYGTYIRNVVRSLARLDQETHYLLLGGGGEMRDQLPPNFHAVPYALPEASPRNIYQLYWLLRRHAVDVLHVPHHDWIPQHLPCPHVVTVHDLVDFLYPVRSGRQLGRWLRYHLIRRSLLHAGRIVAVSRTTQRDIERTFGVPAGRISVVYNAIDERFLRGHSSPAERAAVAARYAMDSPFVLYTGSVQPHKNVVRLIEAFAALKADLAGAGPAAAELANLKLIVIGDEVSRHPALRRAMVRCRMQNEVRFLGFVPVDVLRVFYDTARVFAFPSLYEGFGLPPLEAMAHGTPVVTSNSSSLPEVLQQSALLVNPDNVYDIMRGLRRCLLDERLRHDLIQAGYAQVARYSWDAAAASMLAIYRQVALEHSRASLALRAGA